MKRVAGLCIAIMLACGCASDKVVPIDRDRDSENPTALSYRDFDAMAAEAVQSLLASGRLASGAVLAMGRVTNDTCIHFPVSLITAKIEQGLTNSGRVRVTSAVAADPAGTEQLIAATRRLRADAEFDAATIAGKGALIAPDLAFSGRITQRNIRRANGGIQVEYHYIFQVTDLKTGLQIWQYPGVIGKRVAPGWPVW